MIVFVNSGQLLSLCLFGLIGMAELSSKCLKANAANGLLCELEVTVCTGFETTAKEEMEEKISTVSNATAARGRVNLLVPIDETKNVRYVYILTSV